MKGPVEAAAVSIISSVYETGPFQMSRRRTLAARPVRMSPPETTRQGKAYGERLNAVAAEASRRPHRCARLA